MPKLDPRTKEHFQKITKDWEMLNKNFSKENSAKLIHDLETFKKLLQETKY